MTTIKQILASVLISMVASIVTAQTVSFSLEPAKLTAEETKAVKQVLTTNASGLSTDEADLFMELLQNGNRMISFGIAEDGVLGLPEGTNVDTYIVREGSNGFAILYEIEDKDGDRAQSASAKVTIKPPHAELSAKEIKLLKERLLTAPFVSEIDSMAYQRRLDHYNSRGTFGIGFTEDGTLGTVPVHDGYYTEAYIIRVGDGVALYYEIVDGEHERLMAIRQTSPISLK